jgi:hypothetical protein
MRRPAKLNRGRLAVFLLELRTYLISAMMDPSIANATSTYKIIYSFMVAVLLFHDGCCEEWLRARGSVDLFPQSIHGGMGLMFPQKILVNHLCVVLDHVQTCPAAKVLQV